MQGYHLHLLIILGLNQDFREKNPLLRVLQCGARRLAKMAPILIIIHSFSWTYHRLQGATAGYIGSHLCRTVSIACRRQLLSLLPAHA
jgi:hypothetical protein